MRRYPFDFSTKNYDSKLPGWDGINDIVPHERSDIRVKKKKMTKKRMLEIKRERLKSESKVDGSKEDIFEEEEEQDIAEEDIGMGGPERRVFWPPTMEDWLRPAKRITSKNQENGKPVAESLQNDDNAVDE